MGGLKDALHRVQPAAPRPGVVDTAAGPERDETRYEPFTDDGVMESTPEGRVVARIDSVEVETIIGNALVRVRFRKGTNPANVAEYLRVLDAGAKVRDEWPVRGGGKRETKSATALTITIDAKGDYKRVSIVCTGESDVTVEVSKRNVEQFLPQLIAIGKLGDVNAAKATKAFEEKKTATIVLGEAERFGVKYSDFEGRCFLEEMMAEPPAAEKAA